MESGDEVALRSLDAGLYSAEALLDRSEAPRRTPNPREAGPADKLSLEGLGNLMSQSGWLRVGSRAEDEVPGVLGQSSKSGLEHEKAKRGQLRAGSSKRKAKLAIL
jgi:hypothetical protein